MVTLRIISGALKNLMPDYDYNKNNFYKRNTKKLTYLRVPIHLNWNGISHFSTPPGLPGLMLPVLFRDEFAEN